MAKVPVVDKEKCIGCGTCIATLPAVFKMGDDGKSEVINPHGASEEELTNVANSCPSGAISLQDEAATVQA